MRSLKGKWKARAVLDNQFLGLKANLSVCRLSPGSFAHSWSTVIPEKSQQVIHIWLKIFSPIYHSIIYRYFIQLCIKSIYLSASCPQGVLLTLGPTVHRKTRKAKSFKHALKNVFQGKTTQKRASSLTSSIVYLPLSCPVTQ